MGQKISEKTLYLRFIVRWKNFKFYKIGENTVNRFIRSPWSMNRFSKISKTISYNITLNFAISRIKILLFYIIYFQHALILFGLNRDRISNTRRVNKYNKCLDALSDRIIARLTTLNGVLVSYFLKMNNILYGFFFFVLYSRPLLCKLIT